MSTSGGSGGGNPTKTAHLNTAQLLALHAAPVTLISAPGAGRAIVVVDATFEFVPTSGTFFVDGFAGLYYTTTPASGLEASTAAISRLLDGSNASPSTSMAVGLGTAGSYVETADIANQPVVVFARPGNPLGVGPIVSATLGDGGTGYAAGDTGNIVDAVTGDGTAAYHVTSVAAVTGAVTAFTVTAPGALYEVNPAALGTTPGGAQPGVGTGLTVNVTAIVAPVGDLYVTATYQILTLH